MAEFTCEKRILRTAKNFSLLLDQLEPILQAKDLDGMSCWLGEFAPVATSAFANGIKADYKGIAAVLEKVFPDCKVSDELFGSLDSDKQNRHIIALSIQNMNRGFPPFEGLEELTEKHKETLYDGLLM